MQTSPESWSEISAYLDQALDLEDGVRGPWLDELEQREPAIAARIRAYLLKITELNEQNFMVETAVALLARTSLARSKVK